MISFGSRVAPPVKSSNLTTGEFSLRVCICPTFLDTVFGPLRPIVQAYGANMPNKDSEPIGFIWRILAGLIVVVGIGAIIVTLRANLGWDSIREVLIPAVIFSIMLYVALTGKSPSLPQKNTSKRRG